jgi:hypothetical protein
MSDYHLNNTFQQTASTESNGYNLFPGAYQSTSVGGAGKRRSSKKAMTKKAMTKNAKKGMKGGDCGCNKSIFKGGAKNRKTEKQMKKGKKSKKQQ